MSKVEEDIKNKLKENKVKFIYQKILPINNYPWKTKYSKNIISDLYLIDYDIYIEIKGFMTIEAMSKMSFLCKQKFKYYIFQATEFEWNPWIMSFNKNNIQLNTKFSKAGILRENIKQQLLEIISLKNKDSFILNISNISLERLKNFISKKINQYALWNKKWY